MWQSVVQFFHSLPDWGWIALYAYVGLWNTMLVFRALREPVSRKLSDAIGKAPDTLDDEAAQGASVIGILGSAAVTVICDIAAMATLGDASLFKGYPRTVCLQMMAIGAVAYALPLGSYYAKRALSRLQARISAAYDAWQERRARDPKRILAMCRKHYEEARLRHDIEFDRPIDEMVGLEQACENALKLLEQLLQLVRHIDEVVAFAARHPHHVAQADAIFTGTPLEKFLHLLGPTGIDGAAFERLRTQAQGSIEDLVLLFKELPGNVAALNAVNEAAGIKGIQVDLATLLPKTSSSDGLIGDLETGRIQERIVNALSAAQSQTAEQTAARTKVRA